MSPKPLGILQKLRRTLIGAPIHTSLAHHEKLTPLLGLPVFSSDALSSVAYATEAILSILILKSIGALSMQFAITLSICVLIVMIAISYTQTIYAYPKGGGSYIVASDNLGPTAGLVAGAALMIDYILTVAVSISAGVAAFVSAYPHFHPYLVQASVGLVILVAWLNLRGMRESGAVFAVPTYGFILGMLAMLGFATYRVMHGSAGNEQVLSDHVGGEASATPLFILLRSFAAGCTALTGIEAVSDGVLSFKEPGPKNARIVLQRMSALLLVMFVGIGYFSQHLPTLTLYSNLNPNYRTVTSQIAAFAFGQNSFGFYYLQFMTMAILVLAANTAFADFPRVASFLARDGYLPRPFARQGDRLVFHNGIIVLGLAAAILVFVFGGQLDHLLPLYAIGVFTAFTLSQAGMVAHWWKLKTPGWQRSMAINVIGTLLTAVVAIIILVTKFMEGAWIAAVLIVLVFLMFRAVKSRYTSMAKQLALGDAPVPEAETRKHVSMLLVPRVHRGLLKALTYAKSMDPNTVALHVTLDERSLPQVRRDWDRYGQGVPLVVLNSPFRSLIQPVLDYVDQLLEQDPNQMITVVVAEAVSNRWYQRLLQENVAAQLKAALAQRRNVAITSIRYFLE